jgi:hypothetical protein
MINIDRIKSTYLLDDVSLVKLFQLFYESIQTDLMSMDKYISEATCIKIHNQAHKLKAGYRYLFFDNIAKELEQIQLHAKNDEIMIISTKYPAIKSSMLDSLEEIKVYLSRNQGE